MCFFCLLFIQIALQQLVLAAPPNVMILAGGANFSSRNGSRNHHHKVPHSALESSSSDDVNRLSFEVRRELEVALRLILGCAVQAETTKEIVISYVTTLDLHVQDALRVEIESITHNRSNVFPLECLTLVPNPSQADLNDLKDAARFLSRLASERNQLLAAVQRLSYLEDLIKCNALSDSCSENDRCSSPDNDSGHGSSQVIEEQAKLYLQVNELKNKLRETQSELESKGESLENCREDLDEKIALVEKLRKENSEFQRDVRALRELRDELDAIKQDQIRAERLERENAKLRGRAQEFELMKKRLEEVREENKVLVEVRAGLERKLEETGMNRSMMSRVTAAEAEAERRRKEVTEIRANLETSQRIIHQLNDRCTRLQVELNQASERKVLRLESSSPCVEERSFGEQLEESVTTKLLAIEVENERLLRENEEAQLRYQNDLETKLDRISELERDLDRNSFDKNEIQQDRERIRMLLERVRDGYESKLRVAFSLISVIKQELLASSNWAPNNGRQLQGKSVPKNAKIICELLDQFQADLKAPVLIGESEISTLNVDENLYEKIRQVLVDSQQLETLEDQLHEMSEQYKSLQSDKQNFEDQCKRLQSEGGSEKVKDLENQRCQLEEEKEMLSARLNRCLETMDILQKRLDSVLEEKQLFQVN